MPLGWQKEPVSIQNSQLVAFHTAVEHQMNSEFLGTGAS